MLPANGRINHVETAPVLGMGLVVTLRHAVAGAPRVEEFHETGLAATVRELHRVQPDRRLDCECRLRSTPQSAQIQGRVIHTLSIIRRPGV